MKQIPSTKRLRASKAAAKRAVKRIETKRKLVSEIEALKYEKLCAFASLSEALGVNVQH